MQIRRYRESDLTEMAELFYHTVHAVCCGDYTQKQLCAWAPGEVDLKAWHARYTASHTLVAEEGQVIVGFANMEESGYLDMLYVHKDYQRRGIAAALCDALEKACAAEKFTVHASITAKPFFEKRGYRVKTEQTVVCRGVEMNNFVMEK